MFRKLGAGLVGAGLTFGATSSAFAYEHDHGFSPKEFREFKLANRRQVSPDTQQLTFYLQHNAQRMGMEVAGIIVTKCKGPDGKNVIRPYTPISQPQQTGSFDLLIKKYPGGKMGTHFHDLPVGAGVEMKGPFKKYDIQANEIPHIGMVAGGTGITPMYQIIQYLLRDASDKTQLSLVYANRSEEDILLKKELEMLEREYPRLRVHYVVQEATFSWKQSIGFVTPAHMETYMPKPGAGKIFVCGPPGMMKHVSGDKEFVKGGPPTQGELSGLLKSAGYTENDVFKF